MVEGAAVQVKGLESLVQDKGFRRQGLLAGSIMYGLLFQGVSGFHICAPEVEAAEPPLSPARLSCRGDLGPGRLPKRRSRVQIQGGTAPSPTTNATAAAGTTF